MDDKAKIQEAIKMQGEVVRKLKAEKASKEQVSVSRWGQLIVFYTRWTELIPVSIWQGGITSVLPQPKSIFTFKILIIWQYANYYLRLCTVFEEIWLPPNVLNFTS